MWTPEDRALVGGFGAGHTSSDGRYRLIETPITAAKPGGAGRRPPTCGGGWTGCSTSCTSARQWRHLQPPAFPPRQTVYGYFRGSCPWERCSSERAVARRPWVPRPAHRLAAPLEPPQRRLRGAADGEAAAGDRALTLAPPAHEPLHQIALVEPAFGQERVGEAERHAGVVGPLPRPEPERPAARHVLERRIGIPGRELERGADGVADR